MKESADDAFSARELRARVLKGGSLPDDSLSAAQIRARHGIAGNRPGWATPNATEGRGARQAMACTSALAIFALLGAAALVARWLLL